MNQPLLTFLAVAVAIACVGVLIYEWLFKHREQVDERLKSEFGQSNGDARERTRLFKDLQKLAQESGDDTESYANRLQRIIAQSGLTITPHQLVTTSVLIAFGAGIVTGVALQHTWGVLVGALVALPIPLLVVAIRRERRLDLLRRQLPDAFEMMSRSIRAGQTVTAAFRTVADDFEAPIADEFAWCFEQQNLGLPYELALRDLADRTGVAELQMLVVSLLVQRNSGGSPVEMLDNLALVVRRRIELQEKMKTLTAEGRLQAAVLLLLPPLLLATITYLNADYVSRLWGRPLLLVGMAVSMLVGLVWIRRILRLEY